MEAKISYKQTLRVGLFSQAIALAMGIALHSSAVLAGRTLFYGKIFTPTLDLLFVPFIVLGGLMGIWGHIESAIRPWQLRLAGLAVSVYFLISIPFHVKTLVSWSTAHFRAFPDKYSLFVIPLQLLFLLIVFRALRAETGSRRGDDPRTSQPGFLQHGGGTPVER